VRLLGRGSRKRPAEHVIVLRPDQQEEKPHVLVCDDNLSVTDLLAMMLTLEGWSVEVTTNGYDCLAAMEQNAPDVVVLDQRMPGLTGLEVAAKARDGGFDRPILLFSAHLESDEWRRLNELGLLPLSKLDFQAVVRHVVAARRQYVTRTTKRAAAEAGEAESGAEPSAG
jgi:CheY-like chemotaxis protein